MVSNAIFNNISVISWRLVLLMQETGETTDLLTNFITSFCIEYTDTTGPE